MDEEKDKYDGLLAEKLELERSIMICNQDIEDHKTRTEEQAADLGGLKERNGVLEGELKELRATAEGDRELNQKVEV